MEFTAYLVKSILDTKKLEEQGLTRVFSMIFSMFIVMLGAASDEIPILKGYGLYFIITAFLFPMLVLFIQVLLNKKVVKKY
ncbi:MAG: hypothetical protein V4642_11230, partial [Bacteroidota bacterium]